MSSPFRGSHRFRISSELCERSFLSDSKEFIWQLQANPDRTTPPNAA